MMVYMTSQDSVESLIALHMPPLGRGRLKVSLTESYNIEDSSWKHYHYLIVDQPKVWIFLLFPLTVFVAINFLYISPLGLLFPQYSDLCSVG